MFVAGGCYTESWLRENYYRLHGILAEYARAFLMAVDAARAEAAQQGAMPVLKQVVIVQPGRRGPEIPVHYEAPALWQVIQVEVPAANRRA